MSGTPYRSAAPDATETAAANLRWVLFALLGTGAVFLAAVGSRRIFEYRVGVVGASSASSYEPTAPVAATVAPPLLAPRNETSTLPETYEISWSRGYFKSDFYLVTADPRGGVSEVARSPAFRWTAEDEPPQADAIAAAHAALVAKLLDEGWEQVGVGDSWYATRYRQPVHAQHVS